MSIETLRGSCGTVNVLPDQRDSMPSPDKRPRAGTTVGAGLIILGLTAFFVVAGVDLARSALDPSSLDRETYLSAVGFGLNPEETQNFLGVMAVVLLGLCALTTSLGIGVLARREGVRHAALGTFALFTIITVPLSLVGLNAEPPSGGAFLGLLIGLADALVVWLLLMPKTTADFERAEVTRQRARFAREEARRDARAGRG
jgi:hypothetical protein